MMKKIRNNLIIYAALALGAISFYFVIFFGLGITYQGKIPAGVMIAGADFSGKTKEEAKNELSKKTEEYSSKTMIIEGKKNNEIKLSELGISFDIEKTVEKAMGQKGKMAFPDKREVPLVFSCDDNAFYKTLSLSENELDKESKNSKIKKEGTELIFTEGKDGERINYAQTAESLRDSIGKLSEKSKISYFRVGPTYTKNEAENLEKEIKESVYPFTVKYNEKEFKISEEEMVSWLYISSEKRTLANRFEKEPFLNAAFNLEEGGSLFSETEVKDTLTNIKKEIDKEPVNAQLQVKDGRAVVFVPSGSGQKLNLESSANNVLEALAKKDKEANLVVDNVEPEISESSLNNMGISELIATGNSNFAGSPENRKHNIKTGASKFNGVLIKPDETFSFNTVLGPVDASTGYLPELVILENKTQPQFGGGLCQVSSTAFRAALNAGLPILERKAHAYPVSYYKPFGVDATIYLPKPDLVFKNDTGKYILMQTRVEGTKLYFDFYGTKPKRSVKFAGSENAAGSVGIVESVNPSIYDKDVRGAGSFTASFWRFIYDESGKLVNTKNFTSKYDSPDKYPKPTQ